MKTGLVEQLKIVQQSQSALASDLADHKIVSEQRFKNFSSEVLWRVKDAEELLKSRLSETRVREIIKELKDELNQTS